MLFRIPIFVAQRKHVYVASPLFFTGPSRSDENLNRILTKLAREIVQTLEQLGRASRHDELAQWAFCPQLTTHRTPLTFELRRRVVKTKYLLVTFEHMNRRLAFTPSVPELWFEVDRHESLETRAELALGAYWRNIERDAAEGENVHPEQNELMGKAWCQVLELSVPVPAVVPKPPETSFLMLGGGETGDGASNLRRVGRCLDWLYPDELDRAVLRDRQVDELEQLLAHRERQPVLLCGPRLAGKTAIVHETVFRRVAARKHIHIQEANVWLISPQRLISGMSYVGQWEGRLLAILKHAAKRNHVLYFDDLIGLFLAGVTSNSSLNAAVVLKPYLERRDVRVLGEITLEGLRVLQERDRGFADLFHMIPVREPSDDDTLRILIEHQRRLEGKRGCSFGLDVIPAVTDLQRRYDRSAAFPGKAATVLARLAIRATANALPTTRPDPDSRHTRRLDPLAGRPWITRDDVLNDFATHSGLSLAFLDPKQRLDRDHVRDQLQDQVIGQSEAVEALADVVSIAKARLNDPDRPLASFLFLGPTGVGKTECAKAIARTLFGCGTRLQGAGERKPDDGSRSSGGRSPAPDSRTSPTEDRLLRFDLNEYNQPGAAARLVGTFSQPEGLLTSAIRRQPFAVILFDEIEKGHPDVFDLLLSVLGEGRLTDALGRTADFTNAIIILTSNLGVRDAESSLGFAPEADRSFAYTRAAERFFRPEFFNRLDRVIPFRKLTRDELGRIARRLVNDVLTREGFAQRQCVLNVSAAAIERVIDSGYDPALGARAMKRAVERGLTQPAAARLAALNPEEFTIVTVRAADEVTGQSGFGLAVDVQAPGWAERTDRPGEEGDAASRLREIRVSLRAVEDQLIHLRPDQPIVGGKITVEQERYFALRDVAEDIAATLEKIEERLEKKRHGYLEAGRPEAISRRARYRWVSWPKNYASDGGSAVSLLKSAVGMEEALREFLDTAEPLPGDQDIFDLENRLALLHLMATAPVDDKPVYIVIRGFPDGRPSPEAETLCQHYIRSWSDGLGVDVERSLGGVRTAADRDWHVIRVAGVHARSLAVREVGTHLFLPLHGGPVPVRLDVADSWPATFRDPFAFGPVLRVYPEGQAIADVRTGLVCPPPFNADLFRTFTLAILPRLGGSGSAPSPD